MADREISDLTAATTPLDGDELVHIDQGGNSRKVALSDVVALSTGAMLKSEYDPNDDGIIAVANGGTNSATASGARTNLGLGTMAVQNAGTVAITGGSVTGITDITVADGGTGASDASGARTNLGLAIGTDVMAYSANLAGFAATTVANVQNRDNHTGTQLAATISDFSTAADLRVAAAVGVTVQAYDALLASVSALSLTAGDIIYATGPDAVAVLPVGGAGQVLSITGGLPAWDTSLVVGGLLAANNLSDVDNSADARANLAVPPVAADRTALAVFDASKDTTALLVEAGFQGAFDAVDATLPDNVSLIAADTVGGEIKVTTGNPNLAYLRQRKNGDLFKTSEFGGGIAGLQVAMAVAALRHDMPTVEMNTNGTLGALTTGLARPSNVRLVGMGDTRFDASGIATYADLVNGFVLDCATTGFTALPSFTAVLRGAVKMTFASAHGLVSGDMVTIYNEVDYSFLNINPTRPYYRDGEHNEVVAVDGLDVYFAYPFENNYTYVATVGASLKAYKAETSKQGLGGFIIDLEGNPIVSTSGTSGIHLFRGHGSKIEGVSVLGATHYGIYTEQCLNVETNNIQSHMKPGSLGGGNPTNQYPLLVGNSRGIRRRACASTSGWHADSLGGGAGAGCVPNSDYYAEDCDFTTTGYVTAAESHGNSRRVTRYNCRMYGGGISLSGADVTFDKCIIRQTNPANVQGIVLTELWGGTFRINNCDIYSSVDNGAASAALIQCDIGLTGSADLKDDFTIEIKGGKIIAPNETNFGYLRNNSPNYSMNIDIDTVVYAPSVSSGRLFRIRNDAGAPASKVCKIIPTGITSGVDYAVFENGYSAAKYKFPTQTGDRAMTVVAGASYVDAAFDIPHGYPVVPALRLQPGSLNGVPYHATRHSGSSATQNRITLFGRDSATNLTAHATTVGWTTTVGE